MFNLIAFFGDPMVIAKPVYDQLWQLAADMGLDDNPYRVGYAQFVAVAETDAEAERLFAPHVEYAFGRGIASIPLYRLAMPGNIPPEGLRQLMASPPPPPSGPPRYRDLVASGAVVAGSPDTVADRLEHLARTFRIGNLSAFMQLGSMPNELTKHSIDLFAAEVMPRLRGIWSEYDDRNRWWPVRLGGRPASPEQSAFAGGPAR